MEVVDEIIQGLSLSYGLKWTTEGKKEGDPLGGCVGFVFSCGLIHLALSSHLGILHLSH